MKLEIKIPEVGESVQEALLAQWYRKDGEKVRKDDVLFVIETDKVTLEITAEADGVLHIEVPEGETVSVGAVVGILDTEEAVELDSTSEGRPSREPGRGQPEPAVPQAGAAASAESPPAPLGAAPGSERPLKEADVAPAVRRLAAEKGVDLSRVEGTGPAGRITKGDVLLRVEAGHGGEVTGEGEPARPMARQGPEQLGADDHEAPERPAPQVHKEVSPGAESTSRKPMSRIRLRIAEHLLEARRNTAMLTTFNEIDMSRAQEMRSKHKESFKKKYGISLGLMSFFVKASVQALKDYPEVNAFIEGKDIVYHHHTHVGVAVGSERGLVVPVIRHADRLSFAEIEQTIAEFVRKISENRLDLSDLEGGTFTISNGGVYGSLLSTPILNSPQSGILGMHKIEDRPVVVDGRIVARPMMYVALSYDHRIIDGREAVGFLKRIKECVEDPERMLFAL
jgi:2-oxoglutarate dehydrogenase E2 component (dihydrolipoamide succinyltransferase)